jgi:TRAP-type C4-dicarboxylate transport system permease large subunit
VKVEHVARPLAPYLVIIFVMLVVLAAVPSVTLLVPRLLGLTS